MEQDFFEKTPLEYCFEGNDLETQSMLMSAISEDLLAAEIFAYKIQPKTVMSIFNSFPEKIDLQDNTSWSSFISGDNTLIEKIKLDNKDKNGCTLLHQAVMRKSVWFIEQLIKAGAATSIQDADGKTALDYATDPGIKALLTPEGTVTHTSSVTFSSLPSAVVGGSLSATAVRPGSPKKGV